MSMAEPATALIRMEGISKSYFAGDHQVVALDGIEVTLNRNDYVAIVGSSGSGKSTLMNILGCLDRASAGRYLLNGQDVAKLSDAAISTIRNREIGFIFQSFNLLPRLSALKNVIQPLVYRRMEQKQRVERARRALDRVGLADRVHHLPNQLSGGQRQRVAIARALVTEPSLLLADEPTGNLDSVTTAEILALFDQLHADGQTVVIVTHDPVVARRCHRQLTLKDGRIIEDRGR